MNKSYITAVSCVLTNILDSRLNKTMIGLRDFNISNTAITCRNFVISNDSSHSTNSPFIPITKLRSMAGRCPFFTS